jgi:acyl carrier protein
MAIELEALKALILEATEKESPGEGFGDDMPLFGPETPLALDSLDALQISMAIQREYGVAMTDSKELRRAMVSIRTLQEYLQKKLG